MSSTVSRVLYQMIIYLDCTLPHSSFAPCGTKRDIPESTTGRRIAFCFVLLRVGFTQPLTLPQERWSLTPPFHPYRPESAVSFLLHWPSGRPDRTLSGTLPCGARTFLTQKGAIICATLLYPSTFFFICKGWSYFAASFSFGEMRSFLYKSAASCSDNPST